MKVTEEMIDAFVAVKMGEAWDGRKRARRVLEVVLADVPDSALEAGCLESMKHNAQRMREHCRRLEAKLARVREWAAGPLTFDRLFAILDG